MPAPTRRSAWRRPLVVGALALVLSVGLVAGVAGAPARAGTGDPPQTEPTAPAELEDPQGGQEGRIIPRPDAGVAPETPGDPGGWQQTMAFLLTIGGMAVLGALAFRESRRRRRSSSP